MRDYSTISPSAKGLLLMKGLTDIPYITAASKLVWGKASVDAYAKRIDDVRFMKRLIHFEERYKSVDNLVSELGGNNFLEISSGFSFRGLHFCASRPDINYIDTDLADLINIKSRITHELITREKIDLQSKLITSAMNALDEQSFFDTIAQLPQGPLTILNEGLLMYLNTNEKISLCKIIHKALARRGGYWVTADVYIKTDKKLYGNADQVSAFLKAHNVDENKFESFNQAEQFFNAQGLKIHKKAGVNWQELSSLQYVPKPVLAEISQFAGKHGRIRETWALSPL